MQSKQSSRYSLLPLLLHYSYDTTTGRAPNDALIPGACTSSSCNSIDVANMHDKKRAQPSSNEASLCSSISSCLSHRSVWSYPTRTVQLYFVFVDPS